MSDKLTSKQLEFREARKRGRANQIKHMQEEKEFRDQYYPLHEFLPNTEYILFDLDRATFGRSCICVPRNKFEEMYSEQLERLRQESDSILAENGILTFRHKMHLEKNPDHEGQNRIKYSFATQFAHRMTHYSEEDLGYIKLFDDTEHEIMDNQKWYRHSVGADLEYAKENTYLTQVFVFDEIRPKEFYNNLK